MTTPERTSTTAPSAFTWNAGGWWGSVFGMTCWMVVLAGAVAPAWRAVGATVACCAVTVGVAVALWRKRAHMRVYTAIQIQIAVGGLCGAAALGAIHALGEGPRLARFVQGQSAGFSWWMLLVYPALMLMFALRERTARRQEPTA